MTTQDDGYQKISAADTKSLLDRWAEAWLNALAAWSKFTRLQSPTLCRSERDAQREGLDGSFAMIRLHDQAVIVSLRQVAAYGLDDYALEILAHEIGHHVLAPAALTDHTRMIRPDATGAPHGRAACAHAGQSLHGPAHQRPVPSQRRLAHPDRREELARVALAHLGYRPAGETVSQAQDRLASLSSTHRARALAASREAEKRAQSIREALRRKAAEESADKWTRE